jgi:hypothetical protein
MTHLSALTSTLLGKFDYLLRVIPKRSDVHLDVRFARTRAHRERVPLCEGQLGEIHKHILPDFEFAHHRRQRVLFEADTCDLVSHRLEHDRAGREMGPYGPKQLVQDVKPNRRH